MFHACYSAIFLLSFYQIGKRQNHNSNAQMQSESSSINAKSSLDYAPQGFAASAASNLSSVVISNS
jgi:hypothetical protein